MHIASATSPADMPAISRAVDEDMCEADEEVALSALSVAPFNNVAVVVVITTPLLRKVSGKNGWRGGKFLPSSRD
jgi:hypothetical protein